MTQALTVEQIKLLIKQAHDISEVGADWGLHMSRTEVLALCEELLTIRAAAPEGQWIPVSERLPEKGDGVVLLFDNHATRAGCLFGHKYKTWYIPYPQVPAKEPTHWMPLPIPPTLRELERSEI